MSRLMPIFLLLGLLVSPGKAQHCTDIRQLPLRNAAIPLDAPEDRGAQDKAREHRGRHAVVQLRDGIGFVSDDPELPNSHDWRVQLLSDRVVQPQPSTWLRLILVEKDHLTGSGNWRYVLALGCHKGRLISVFHHRAEGLHLKLARGPKLELVEPVWTKQEAHCCPSRQRKLHYRWSRKEHRYRRLRHPLPR